MTRLLLVTNDYPPKTGGIQVYLHELLGRYGGERVAVLTASSHPDAEIFDRFDEAAVERVKASTLFFPSWKAYRAIEDAIERHKPELVLFDPVWPLGLLGPRLSRPYGVILHGAEVAIPSRIPIVASSLRYVLRRARVAICAGSFPEEQARRSAAENLCPIIQVPPGVDIDRFVPISREHRHAVRNNMGLRDDEFLVASYSRLVPRKGMDTLIRASSMIHERYPQLRVVIAGSGRDRKRLERLAKKLNAPVNFLGQVSDDLLPDWLGASDLMVMDCRSRWLGLEQEGFGIVYVEAAACGLAQIAGRSGGSHDAVRDGETGIVLNNPRSASDLANAISSLIENAELRSVYGLAARDLTTRKFSWARLRRELADGLQIFGDSKPGGSPA